MKTQDFENCDTLDSRKLKDLISALLKRIDVLQESKEELEKKSDNHTIAMKNIEDKLKKFEASRISTALMENDGIEMNDFLTLKSIQENTAIKLWKYPIQRQKKIGFHFKGIVSFGVMNLQAKRDNLRGQNNCGMNGHKNSIGCLINSSTADKGKIDIFNEGQKLFSREGMKFKATDKIWMSINLIGEIKQVIYYYQPESAKDEKLLSISLSYKHVFPFVAFFTKGSTVEILY